MNDIQKNIHRQRRNR